MGRYLKQPRGNRHLYHAAVVSAPVVLPLDRCTSMRVCDGALPKKRVNCRRVFFLQKLAVLAPGVLFVSNLSF